MTCRCGAEFCYVCGLRWRTCHCTMEQLTAAKDQAFARRRARLEKEAEEEAEMQEAIRQVEEFEREEALKAELLRREQARIAEERQRRELQERITREGQRRRAVTAKYEELREIFTRLASEQRTIVQKDHNTREHKIRQSGEKTVQSLRASNQEEWEHHESRIEAKIAKRRAEDSQELTARIMEERLIEKQYADQLGAFWAKRPNGTNQACAAIRSFKREMDKNFVAWKKFADDDFDQFTHAAREELAIRRELMVEAERRAEKKKRDDELEFAQRKHAELRWMREVFQERERMLNDMEVEEMDNGEDTDTWFAEPSLVDDSSDSEGNAEENFGYAAYVEYAAYRIPGAFP
ncbi:hypothetical protein GGR57DRAFT_284996 [Xylariaceae sp. FL1272]|nr:hypothetical protein GGR57DRAFT_284996 [Xylariaceae sp. FL1272]